jgi:hypothetical protein
MSHVHYLSSPLARWLDLQKTPHVTATQPDHWRADCCLATSYNFRPFVACAYREVFIEPLPSNALRKSVTVLKVCILSIDCMYVFLVILTINCHFVPK